MASPPHRAGAPASRPYRPAHSTASRGPGGTGTAEVFPSPDAAGSITGVEPFADGGPAQVRPTAGGTPAAHTQGAGG